MSGLRDGLDEMATDSRAYGDLEAAIQQADLERRRNIGLATGIAAAASVLVLIAGVHAVSRDRADDLQPVGPTTTGTPGPALSALADGPVTPGRYRYDVFDLCAEVGCTAKPKPLPDVLVTVPAGWDAITTFNLIERDIPVGAGAPDGAGLVMGWTNYWVSLFSEPCRQNDDPGDVPVGPTVDDFVDAVVAHPLLDVTDPKPVQLGKHRGRFLTLIGPSDISHCGAWKPWDPSPHLQGPGNRWDLWVMNVDRVRMLIMAGYYPGTPAAIKDELRAMAESIRFLPSARQR